MISPVADYLRSRLGQVNWGRNELGLPLVQVLFLLLPLLFKRIFLSQLSDDKIEDLGTAQFNNHSNHQSIPKHKPISVNNATKQHSVLNIDSISAQSEFQSKSFGLRIKWSLIKVMSNGHSCLLLNNIAPRHSYHVPSMYLMLFSLRKCIIGFF